MGMMCTVRDDEIDVERQAYLQVMETSDPMERLAAFKEALECLTNSGNEM
jgi:hypothetical protein